MRVLLIDVGSKFPNLALMKLSAYHKARGDRVFFRRCCNPHRVYISCVFMWNRGKALGIAKMFPQSEVVLGGSGINYEDLPYEIEHCMPDYNLYGIDYSLGFTTRGCVRKCPWCIVPKKEGVLREHAEISEFLHPDHEKLVLLDNNFLASSKWKEKLNFLTENGIKVNFSQGLDIRLINEENAGMLADVSFWSLHFTRKYLYFSFDLPSMEEDVRRGVQTLNEAGIKSTYLVFYMLVGFNSTFKEDLHRFNVLRELGVRPFVMVYNRKNDPTLRAFARWANRPAIYKSCSWEEYKRRPKKG